MVFSGEGRNVSFVRMEATSRNRNRTAGLHLPQSQTIDKNEKIRILNSLIGITIAIFEVIIRHGHRRSKRRQTTIRN